MLIEFVGCSSAGKTTLINKTLAALSSRGLTATVSSTRIAAATGTSWVRNPRLRNLLLSVLLLPWFVKSLASHRLYYPFALRIIWRDASTVVNRLSRLRSQMRLMAVDELVRAKKQKDELILVDEGSLGNAHNVLVNLQSPPRPDEVSQYVKLAPAPDLIIHVEAPVEVALERTMRRPDKPLWGPLSQESFASFIRHGAEVFKMLASDAHYDGRLLTVVNDDDSFAKTDALITQIVEFMLDNMLRTNECSIR